MVFFSIRDDFYDRSVNDVLFCCFKSLLQNILAIFQKFLQASLTSREATFIWFMLKHPQRSQDMHVSHTLLSQWSFLCFREKTVEHVPEGLNSL